MQMRSSICYSKRIRQTWCDFHALLFKQAFQNSQIHIKARARTREHAAN